MRWGVSRECWTHWGQVTLIWVSKIILTGSDNGLVTWSAQSHYLNQCWNIVNWTLRNKFEWNCNWNSNLFIHENALENICQMVSISSRSQCVKICFMCYSCHWWNVCNMVSYDEIAWCQTLVQVRLKCKNIFIGTRSAISSIIHNARCQVFVVNDEYLTHWGWDKMATIFQMPLSNAFSWMKMY